MTSRSSFLPRLSFGGGNGNNTLPTQHQRTSNDYDLSELSPRPSSPLLSPDHVRDFGFKGPRPYDHSVKGKGKSKVIAYAETEEQFPPVSVVDRMRVHRENQAASRARERQMRDNRKDGNVPSWKPQGPSDYRHDEMRTDAYHTSARPSHNQGAHLGSSFMGLLNPSPSSTERKPAGEVDNTFRNIQRREHQIQKELQKLLDAQAFALERGDTSNGTSQDGTETPKGASRASSSPYRSHGSVSHEESPSPTVIPVRQPKPRPLTIRQVRTSIARSMAMLSDLKEEEDAYIASAISSRKTALAKANKLSHQHKAIATDMRALETDDPLRRELEGMNDEYGKVCANIEEFEGKLRQMKHQKRVLETRMEEVKSERESGLSGYKGALRETERDIGEMMRIPGVKVLSIEESSNVLQAEGREETAENKVLDRALSGHEFMRMRPERRTLAMAKEWWEGEMELLSRRKDAVDKERDALFEGSDIWAQTVQLIIDYEKRLGTALNMSIQAGPRESQKPEADLFQLQYKDLQQTIREMEKNLQYVEEKGWNLLVAAIGAELEGFMEGENILAGLMRSKGYNLPDTGGLVELDGERNSQTSKLNEHDLITTDKKRENDDDDELTGSVVRRWGGQSGPGTPLSQKESHMEVDTSNIDEPPSELLTRHDDHYKDESDNEVPADLLVSRIHVDESEEEHGNEVPAEFLSVHDKGVMNHHEEEVEEGVGGGGGNEVPKDLLGGIEVSNKDDGVD